MKAKLFLPLLVSVCALAAVSVSAQSYAITNARIVTVSGPTIERGTVVIRDGLIHAVGANLQPPADARIFDGTGLTVYPGFIDALTSLGIPAPTPGPGGGGGGGGFQQQLLQQQQQQQQAALQSNSNYPVGLRPERSAADEIRAGEQQFEAARNAGLTTVLSVARNGIFNGQSVVINLAGDSTSRMIVRSPVANHVSFVTIGGGQYPASLLGTFSALRQMMLDAQRLQEWQRAYAANPRGIRRPDADRSLEALIPVISGRMPIVFNANTERQIIRALDLIREFKLNGIIAGGEEAWKQAERLKAQNVPVLLSLNLPRRSAAASPDADPENLDTLRLRAEAPKNAGRLAAAGVKFAFQSTGVNNLGDFFVNAGTAIENGLSRDAAVRAMTLGSAEILGIADRLGSIEPGKIANLTLVRGDLFARGKFVPQVIIDGKVFEIREPARPQGGPGRGAGQPGGQPAANPALPNLSGGWSINIDVPGQPVTAVLNLNQSGPALTGTFVTDSPAQIRNGRVTATGFSFATTVVYQGQSLEITVNGTVTGNQISGTIESPLGPVPFSGTKNP